MSIKKRKDFDINLILKKLSRERTINTDGSVTIKDFSALENCESILRTCVVAEGKTDAFISCIVKKAIREEQDLTESKFLKHCNRLANTEMKNNSRAFKVVFPLWGGNGLVLGRRRWNDTWIKFDINKKSSFARRAIADRAELLQSLENNISRVMKGFESLPLAVCSVQAINQLDAFEQAECAISKELGLFSLCSIRGKFILTNDPNIPINTILLAPYMTVHEISGVISPNIYWYNRWPNRMIERARPQSDIRKIQNSVKLIRERVRALPWRQEAENALARHYSAFAQCDLEASFLDGWRLLEAIGGHSREKSETLVKRAAWFFENRDEYYQIGLHLMHRRNLVSHGRPVKDDGNENLAFQMKEFITPFFRAFLTNPFRFQDLSELWSFCDLSVDAEKRKRQAYFLECASKFRSER